MNYEPFYRSEMTFALPTSAEMKMTQGYSDPALRNPATRRLREHHLYEMKQEGLTLREIMARTGVCRHTIWKHIKREANRRSKAVRKQTWP